MRTAIVIFVATWLNPQATIVIFVATWLNPQATIGILGLKLCFHILEILRQPPK